MAVIIPPQQSIGASIGQGLGGGLGGILMGLAENRLTKMNREEIARGLEAAGYNPTDAHALAALPEEDRKLIIQQRGQQALITQKQQFQGAQNKSFANALSGLIGGQQQPTQIPKGQELLQQPPGNFGQAIPEGLTEGQTSTLAKLGLQQQQHRENIALKKEQFEKTASQREQSEINKETQKFYEETNKKRKAAKVNDQRLGRMETLINEGNLQNPVLYGALKKVGLDIPALQSANSQEFVKLTTDFLRNAKDVFGSRVTNYDAQAFLKTVPELSQSDEGKKRIIRNMRLLDKGEQLRGQAQDSIIKENGGKRPRNLESLVEERVAPELDALAQQFKAGAEAPLSLQELKPGTKFKTLQQADSLPVGAIVKKKNGQRMQKTATGWKPAPHLTNKGI